ncbi:MAG: BufA1 family periplasmic bufferin-type metallophore [Pseudonocardiaceae bacterium]
MNTTDRVIRSAFAGLLALGVTAAVTAPAFAADTEKCAGVVKAGKNDCGTSTLSCHGSVAKDNDKEAWFEVPKGTCERIAGGYVTDRPWNAPGGLAEYKQKGGK